jgi:hypothetical protein
MIISREGTLRNAKKQKRKMIYSLNTFFTSDDVSRKVVKQEIKKTSRNLAFLAAK